MKRSRLPSVIFALGTVLAMTLAGARPVAAQGYIITDLGTLGGDSSEAFGINNSGQVVGWSSTAGGAIRAFLYSGGMIQDLGTLPGGSYSYATGINDLGQVVGYGGINEYGPQFREFMQAFISENGGMRSLGALYCPCSFNRRYGTSASYGINGAGQVVGDSETLRGESVRHAFLWESGAMQDIGGGAGSWSISRAYAINDAAQVVGDFAQDAGLLAPGTFDRRASLWQSGIRQELGTLPGHTSSTAFGVNESGQVVGKSGNLDGSASRAFLWQSGAMEDLGVLPGDVSAAALGINANGKVVGSSGNADGSASRGFLWDGVVMHDLNDLIPADSGWTLTSAHAINDAGQIAGTGILNGRGRAFLLTPDASSADPRIEQDDAAVSYTGSWYPTSHALLSGGSAALSMEAGARATVTFIGTGVSWIGYRDEWSGIARIYIDGVFVSEVDTYLGAGGPQAVLYSTSGLSNAAHTLTIEVTGTKNPASSGLWIWVDAFDISTDSSPPPPPPPAPSGGRVEESDQAVDYTGSWYSTSHALLSGGSAALSMEAGARATVTFAGTGISWIGYRDEWSGIARVYIDGALAGEVDTYASPGGVRGAVYSASGLSNAAHTLTIEVTGTKNPASSGLWIWVDAFDIAP